MLGDHVRLEFGAGGAPADTGVSLTQPTPVGYAEHLSTGTALVPFGVPLFDISPIDLGQGGSLRIGLDAPIGSTARADLPATVDITLWEPTTGTRRQVPAQVDTDAGELVIAVDEIRGEIMWASCDGVAVIDRQVGRGTDSDGQILPGVVSGAVRPCGVDRAYTLRHVGGVGTRGHVRRDRGRAPDSRRRGRPKATRR